LANLPGDPELSHVSPSLDVLCIRVSNVNVGRTGLPTFMPMCSKTSANGLWALVYHVTCTVLRAEKKKT
jgi:hypothetical protein